MPESRRYRGDVKGVEWGGMECNVWIMEDSSIGVRTWLQLMCCALLRNKVVLNF